MYTQNAQPEAHVTVGKNRQKKGDKIYLKNGQEFEIELKNTLAETILAQIWLNDEVIGGGGIILRPGEKIYLERYLDKAKKFKFETYEVASNDSVVDNAIRNNGKVEIKFFTEVKPLASGNGTILIADGNWNQWNNGWPYTYIDNTGGNPIPNTFTTSGINYSDDKNNDITLNSMNCMYHSTSDISFSQELKDSILSDNIKSFNKSLKKSKKTKETGRVEEGGNSSQQITYVNKTFNTWAFHSIAYQILPASVKPVLQSDIKVYCTSCGSKQKKGNWKFCPSCGNKFE